MDEIDSIFENPILAKNKKDKAGTLKNIVTFQIEQTTMSWKISYELTNSYNFQRQDKSKTVTFQVEPNENIDPIQWRHLLHLFWQMLFCHFIKSNGLNSARRNLNQFFTEDMLKTFLLSLNQLSTSRHFAIILILAIHTCLLPLSKKRMKSCHFLI